MGSNLHFISKPCLRSYNHLSLSRGLGFVSNHLEPKTLSVSLSLNPLTLKPSILNTP